MTHRPGYLLLEDGRRFDGMLEGAVPAGLPSDNAAPGIGEVVFQTGMTGYQEVLTDPSYCGQIVVFTSSHIGNTGINRIDAEADRPALAGIVTRNITHLPSSWRSEESLPHYLIRHGVTCLTEVDTRALTRHLRTAGALRGCLVPISVDPEVALARVRSFPGLSGRDLVREVSPAAHETTFAGMPTEALGTLFDEFPLTEGASLKGKRITLVHCGMKQGIDDALRRRGALVRLVAPTATALELRDGDPDALFLSNGPGDPQALPGLIASVRGVLGTLPVFGICLGHQVLALALGGQTYKMKHGHHGINHPVQDTATGRVLVTSQNHGFAVDPDSLTVRAGGDVTGTVVVTHVSLNDGIVEGFAVPELSVRAVQFHPEACAGPRDARSLFDLVGARRTT